MTTAFVRPFATTPRFGGWGRASFFPKGRTGIRAGNTYDRSGRMLTCEHATSRVTRTEHDGSITGLATHYKGKELNSPNDVVVKSDGWIYFTDPTYGRTKDFGVERPLQLDHRGVYRVREDGSQLTLLAGDFGQPNGLCF